MRLLPRRLLNRTALLIALLMLLSHAALFSVARVFYQDGLRKVYLDQVAGEIMLAQAALDGLPPDAGPSLHERIHADAMRLVPEDGLPAGLVDGEPYASFREQLQDAVGAPVLVKHDRGDHVFWVGFDAGHTRWWLSLPSNRFRALLPLGLLVAVAFVFLLSVLGAYLGFARLNSRLQKLLQAAQAVGRGETPTQLDESGAEEIQQLSRGFNQMNADLQRMDEERRLMLAGISHDLRSPLARLRLGVEMVSKGAEPCLLQDMVSDIEDMDQAIGQFLDYARDASEEKPASGDLNKLVVEICGRKSPIPVVMGLGQLPTFNFRRRALRRMLANLVDNAIRHGGGAVEVVTRHRNRTVTLTVSDRGPGLGKLDPRKLVQPFVRGDSARSTPGSGLGLTIADRIAHMHGGQLHLSDREGGGLVVRVELPLS